MDLNIEENTLKHISEGIEYYLCTFLKLTTNLGIFSVNFQFLYSTEK